MILFEKEIFNKTECDHIKELSSEFVQSYFKGGTNNEIGYNLKRRNSLKGDLWIIKGSNEYNKLREVFLDIGYELLIDKVFLELYKYNEGHFISKHVDNDVWGNPRFGQLCIQMSESNEYEGGELLYYDKDDNPFIVDRKIGNSVLFTHEVWHEVKPITKGTRLSLIYTVLESDLKPIYKKALI